MPLEGVGVVDLDGHRHMIGAGVLDVLRLNEEVVARSEVDPLRDVLPVEGEIASVIASVCLLVDEALIRGVQV